VEWFGVVYSLSGMWVERECQVITISVLHHLFMPQRASFTDDTCRVSSNSDQPFLETIAHSRLFHLNNASLVSSSLQDSVVMSDVRSRNAIAWHDGNLYRL
jgi:hypothetical protein